jgi:hypothetical protein
MSETRVSFPCGELSLKGALSLPPGEGTFPGVVLCHPHPLRGGDMNNNVVLAIYEGLARLSVACLRFNFRGVRGSEGEFAQGVGEREDAKAALSFLETREGVDGSRLGLCGYSFGTTVAFPVAAEDERVRAVVGISPLHAELLRGYAKPKFLIWGTHDQFIAGGELTRVMDKLPEPKERVIIPGADHFWWGYEKELADRVASYFAGVLR